MGLSTRQVRVLILVGVVIGFVAVPAVAAFLDNAAEVDGVTLHASDGPAVRFSEAGQADLTDFTSDSNTIDYHSTAGNISVSSDGRTNATVTRINGSWTNVSSIDADDRSLTIDPDDKSAVTVDGGVSKVHFRDGGDVELGDDETDLVYSADGEGSITLNSLPANTEFTAATTSGTDLGTYETDGDGEATIDVDGGNDEQVILFENDAPEVDNESAEPTSEIGTSTPTLSVNVSDSQFDTVQGEELTVDWYVDGEQVDTTTESSNGTASIEIDSPETGGDHNWSVEVSDKYGAITESETFEFATPSELTIRNVSAPNDTISGATAELTFYYNDETTRRSDDDEDGVIELEGLPVDEKFVVVVDAEGYNRRHIIVDSLFEQSAVYLLDENATTVETRFQIDDPTGEFEAGDTEVLVQRSIERDYDDDGDLESRYSTVAADEAGVAGFTTALEEDARYRLIVRNDDGDKRTLGSYTATVAETVTLEPTPLGVELGNETAYNATAGQKNTSSGEELVFEFNDGAEETTDLTLSIWEQNNRSNQPSGFENVTFDGPLGQAKHVEPLESDEDGLTWIVHYEATRNDKQITGEYVVGPNIQDPLTGAIPAWLRHATAIVTLILVAGLFSQLNAGVGAVTTSIVGGGFWWLGFLPSGAGGAVVVALFAAILFKAGGDQ